MRENERQRGEKDQRVRESDRVMEGGMEERRKRQREKKERERGELASQAYNKIRPQVYQSNL